MKIYVTICCSNYLPKAAALVESVKFHEPFSQFVCCIVESEIPSYHQLDTFDLVISAKDLQFDNFNRFLFRYSILEATTAIKAKLLLELFHQFPECDSIVYLDPDILVISPFLELDTELLKTPILVTPHHLHDEPTWDGVADNMLRTLMCGTYNLGFIAIHRCSEAINFLHWWHSKLAEFCLVDFSRGLFVDQKWIDIAIPLFNIGILKHQGYNVANWNVSQRKLTLTCSGEILVNKDWPLRFFHFSSIDSGRDLRHLRRHALPDDYVFTLRQQYKKRLLELGHESMRMQDWSYGTFYTGERILPETRLAFRKNRALRETYDDPFTVSNEAILSVGYPPS